MIAGYTEPVIAPGNLGSSTPIYNCIDWLTTISIDKRDRGTGKPKKIFDTSEYPTCKRCGEVVKSYYQGAHEYVAECHCVIATGHCYRVACDRWQRIMEKLED